MGTKILSFTIFVLFTASQVVAQTPQGTTPPSNTTTFSASPWVADWTGTMSTRGLSKTNKNGAEAACKDLAKPDSEWDKFCKKVGMVAKCEATKNSKITTVGQTDPNAAVTCSCSCEHPDNPTAMFITEPHLDDPINPSDSDQYYLFDTIEKNRSSAARLEQAFALQP